MEDGNGRREGAKWKLCPLKDLIFLERKRGRINKIASKVVRQKFKEENKVIQISEDEGQKGRYGAVSILCSLLPVLSFFSAIYSYA